MKTISIKDQPWLVNAGQNPVPFSIRFISAIKDCATKNVNEDGLKKFIEKQEYWNLNVSH